MKKKYRNILLLLPILFWLILIYSSNAVWYNWSWIRNPNATTAARLGSQVTYWGIAAYKDSYLWNKYWQATPGGYIAHAAAVTYCSWLWDWKWRLPSPEELYSLSTYTTTNSNNAYSMHPNIRNDNYWTSMLSPTHAGEAIYVWFGWWWSIFRFTMTWSRSTICIHN